MKNMFLNSWAAENSIWYNEERNKFNENNGIQSKNNHLELNSINEFKNYISRSREISFGGTKSDTEYTAWFKFNLVFIAGIIFYVKQKLTPVYEVLEVTSSDWGLTVMFSWEQTSYNRNTSGDFTTINIYGKIKYNIYRRNWHGIYRVEAISSCCK